MISVPTRCDHNIKTFCILLRRKKILIGECLATFICEFPQEINVFECYRWFDGILQGKADFNGLWK